MGRGRVLYQQTDRRVFGSCPAGPVFVPTVVHQPAGLPACQPASLPACLPPLGPPLLTSLYCCHWHRPARPDHGCGLWGSQGGSSGRRDEEAAQLCSSSIWISTRSVECDGLP
jgi:hypothetical protein